MAASPQFKVYRNGEYIAAVKYAEDAAVLAAMGGDVVVKYAHRKVVWREGSEEFPAAESYDRAANIMAGRAYN
jgi:hypothetical protein